MENALLHPIFSRIGELQHRFAGRELAEDQSILWIVAASVQNYPEFASLSVTQIALGSDDLIRLALWSASKCCATLSGTRRASLLLFEMDSTWEIRCFVVANASLATPQPLSGFLLKPVELLDGRVFRGAHQAHRTPEDNQNRAAETRLALFDAFPVDDDGENVRSGELTLAGSTPVSR